MSPKLIGISGRKRAGKDTLASFLIEQHGYTRVAFADPLKQIAADLDPIIGHLSRGGVWRLSDSLTLSGWEHAKGATEVRRLALDAYDFDGLVDNSVGFDHLEASARWIVEGGYAA